MPVLAIRVADSRSCPHLVEVAGEKMTILRGDKSPSGDFVTVVAVPNENTAKGVQVRYVTEERARAMKAVLPSWARNPILIVAAAPQFNRLDPQLRRTIVSQTRTQLDGALGAIAEAKRKTEEAKRLGKEQCKAA